MTWNGLWTDDVRYNFKIINILIACEIILAFSPLGFIVTNPVSVTTLHLFVIVAALWGGPVGGGLVGLTFGLCSLWKAEVTGTSAADLMYAPSQSGNFMGSLFLSIGSRALYGIIVGFIFLFLLRVIRTRKLPVLCICSIVMERLHSTLIYLNMNIFFHTNNAFFKAFTSKLDLQKIIQIVAIIVLVTVAYELYRHLFSKKLYENYKAIRDELPRKKSYSFIPILVFLILVVLTLAHMLERMQIIWNIENLEFTSYGRTRVLNVFIQFTLALASIWVILLTYFSYRRDTSMLEAHRVLQNQAELEIEFQKKANEAKTEFLSTMSHDIRTPMNAICGFTDIAIRNIDDKEKTLDCLRNVRRSSSHMVTLINDILDISKIESGKINITPREFNFRRKIQSLIESMTPAMEKKCIKFESDINIPDDLFLYADDLRIGQIGINIFSNAIKYTSEGGSIYLGVNSKDNHADQNKIDAELIIRDTGVGMSEEFMKVMFEPFSREIDGRIARIEGTGLGLAIVKRIVDILGGTITCNSTLGKGTEFIVTATFEKAHDIQKDIHKELAISTKVNNISILIAEDMDINYIIVKEFLKDMNIKTTRACNGQECYNMLLESENDTYQLILMDLQMPILNGYEATKLIRKIDEPKGDIPIIAMTADAFAEDVDKCIACGMNGHISKPILPEVLKTEIYKLIKRID